MELIPLELETATILKSEVDKICLIYERDINNQQTSKSDKIRFIDGLSQRIEEIEDFFVSNSADERALLFENQSIRLRRLVAMHNNQMSKAGRDSIRSSSANNSVASRTAHKVKVLSLRIAAQSLRSHCAIAAQSLRGRSAIIAQSLRNRRADAS
jgi:hypothetical protein